MLDELLCDTQGKKKNKQQLLCLATLLQPVLLKFRDHVHSLQSLFCLVLSSTTDNDNPLWEWNDYRIIGFLMYFK